MDKAYPNLDFEINIVEICYKLSEIYYFEVEHAKFKVENSKFDKPNCGDFVNLPIF